MLYFQRLQTVRLDVLLAYKTTFLVESAYEYSHYNGAMALINHKSGS